MSVAGASGDNVEDVNLAHGLNQTKSVQQPEITPEAKPKRACVFRSQTEWDAIRAHYQTSELTTEQIAAHYKIPFSTVEKRCWREGWKKDGMSRQMRKIVAEGEQRAIQLATDKAVERVAESLADKLQPIIEAEKVELTHAQIRRSKGHLGRLDRYLDRKTPLEPKDEAYLAKAVSSHLNDFRKTLGLGDGSGFSGNLSVQILAGQAAVQVNQD